VHVIRASASCLTLPESDAQSLDEIVSGLASEPKRLPCKLFYDDHGSQLFERICELPEYYPTRAELEILHEHAAEMARLLGPGAVLVELGSGASVKTRVLLDALESPEIYVPIDISTATLLDSARALGARYPSLDVRPLALDYTRELSLPLSETERERQVSVFFPGSTIGNFEPAEASEFLRRVRRASGKRARLLIGVDLPKERHVLEAAYDDAAGVTAQFNRNILRVLNRDYGGHFALDDFEHRAVWNESQQRVEMHLVSRRAHVARLGALAVQLRAGESIVTEYCYKYCLDDFRELAASAGFEVAEVWLDSRGLFSVQLLTAH
jgi:dimethylhistidine N-methyltransferase